MDNDKQSFDRRDSTPQPSRQPADITAYASAQQQSNQIGQQHVEPLAPNNLTASSPASSDTQTTTGASSKSRRKIPLTAIAVLAAVVVLGGAAVFAFSTFSKHNAELSCTPIAGSSAVKANALPTFKSFAQAVKQKNQACVDALSSGFFKQQQAAAFPHAHGNWLTAHQTGMASLADDLATLPDTLNDANFTQTPYTRPLTSTAEQPNVPQTYQPAGLTLSYPLDGPNGVSYHVAISILAEDHKVVVDNMVVQPVEQGSNNK